MWSPGGLRTRLGHWQHDEDQERASGLGSFDCDPGNAVSRRDVRTATERAQGRRVRDPLAARGRCIAMELLIIDDDDRIVDEMKSALEAGGRNFSFTTALNLADARAAL